jgi:molecular chaperone Hsp33
LLSGGLSIAEIVKNYLGNIKLIENFHEHEFSFRCKCSESRVARSLTMIGREALDEMIEENKTFEITCEFCSKLYLIDVESLKEIRAELNVVN